MVCDEAPAATIGGLNGNCDCDRPQIGPAWETPVQFLGSDPTSLVAAEIHLGHKPAGICDGWLHCNIQVACQPTSKKYIVISMYCAEMLELLA